MEDIILNTTPEKWNLYILVVITLLLMMLVIYILQFIVQWRRWVSKINLLPGPDGIPVFGNALQAFRDENAIFKNLSDLVRKHGPIFRFWFGPVATVNISKAEYVEAVLGSAKNNEKSFVYTFLHPWVGQGILTSSGEQWLHDRKMLTPTFHFKILEIFNDVFNAKSKILIDKLKPQCGTGKPFDIHPYVTGAALDIICQTAMGININAQEEEPVEFVKSIYKVHRAICIRSRRPWLFPDAIYYLTPNGKEFVNTLKVLHDFTYKVIEERRASRKANPQKSIEKSLKDDTFGKKSRVAFLDMLLDAQENGSDISDSSIREQVDTFMIAGHDTNGSSISWTLYLLGLYKDKQELVFQEIDEIFKGEDRPMTTADSTEMRYLERVIKESLRIYPSIAVIGRNLAEDVQMGDFVAPAGVGVMLQIHELHRDPRFFPNPDVFDPDRFLPERSRGRHPYAYIPFSAGPRNCLGQRFAMVEQKAILSSILRKYRVSSVDRREDLVLSCDIVLRPMHGYNILLNERK